MKKPTETDIFDAYRDRLAENLAQDRDLLDRIKTVKPGKELKSVKNNGPH